MAETEKITINLGVVDLGQVDLLVEQGLYSNRTDFIRTAIRNQIKTHEEIVKQAVVRRSIAVGVLGYSRRELEFYRAKGEQRDIVAIGMVHIANDVTPELVLATIASIKVYGVLQASQEVKNALVDRVN